MQEKIRRGLRTAFLLAFPVWTVYKVAFHYWLWRASSNPADRAVHWFRALAWAVGGIVIVLSLLGMGKNRNKFETN